MQLPTQLTFPQLLTRWSSILNPQLSNPLNSVSILKDVHLSSGTNVINHLLGRIQQGWFLVDIQGSSPIYRSAPFNDKTLTLISGATQVCSIGVF